MSTRGRKSDAFRALAEGLMDMAMLQRRRKERQEDIATRNAAMDWQMRKYLLEQEAADRERREARGERDVRFDIGLKDRAWDREMEALREKRAMAESDLRMGELKSRLKEQGFKDLGQRMEEEFGDLYLRGEETRIPPAALKYLKRKYEGTVKEETPPKVPPNIIADVRAKGEEALQTDPEELVDIFNKNFRGQIPHLQRSYPGAFGPNAADSIVKQLNPNVGQPEEPSLVSKFWNGLIDLFRADPESGMQVLKDTIAAAGNPPMPGMMPGPSTEEETLKNMTKRQRLEYLRAKQGPLQ